MSACYYILLSDSSPSPARALFHPAGAPGTGPGRGGRFGQKSSIFGPPPGFPELNPDTKSAAVFVSVPKNTLISRAPNRAGCRKWGGRQEGLRHWLLFGPSGGMFHYIFLVIGVSRLHYPILWWVLFPGISPLSGGYCSSGE